ncbi:MAG: SURF1 family protein [Gammaproteobacteria bacterium]|nr:SURF1 family protein [Gammaproteobacteria bacterium]
MKRQFIFDGKLLLVAVVIVSTLWSLGLWQRERGLAKQAFELKSDILQQGDSVDITHFSDDLHALSGMNAHVLGRFDTQQQYLHDNRLRNGVAGYHVLTALRLSGQSSAILVNRGWVVANHDRRQLPDVLFQPESLIKISGRAMSPVTGVFTLGGDEPSAVWPKRMQTIDIKKWSKQLNYPLLPIMILLDADATHGYARDWDNLLPGKYMTADKHFAYAYQWFGLAIVALLVFGFLSYRLLE